MELIISVVLSFEKEQSTYMEGFAWLIRNLFACIKIKEVWAFVTYRLSIFLVYPSCGGDFSMTPIILGWLLFSTTTIEDDDLMICTIIYPGMSPPFGEEFLRPLRRMPPVLKL